MLNISISSQTCTQKPVSQEERRAVNSALVFENSNVSVEELIQKIKDGHVFCHNYGKQSFGVNDKTKNNFRYANCVFIDVDDTTESIEGVKEQCLHKPTFIYTTLSHGIKGNRYRLVFVFRDNISSAVEYKGIVKYLAEGLPIIDNVSYSACQMYYGSCDKLPHFQFLFIGELYSTTMIPLGKVQYDYNIETTHTTHNTIALTQLKDNEYFTKEQVNEFLQSSIHSYISKYNFPMPECTPMETNVPDNIPYILYPSDYVEIRRYWIMEQRECDGELRWCLSSKVHKLKDGEHRRRKLFVNGCLRLYIAKRWGIEITPLYVLNCVAYEFDNYINNNHNPITKKELINITLSIIKKYDESLIKPNAPHKFKVNHRYCETHGITPQAAVGIANKLFRYEQIGELYDCSLTNKENIESMKKNGLCISESTLKRFLRDNGISKRKQRNHTFTIRIGNVSDAVFYRLYNEY